ncbi:glycosyltransferase family 4 protein [archaeon AH-315-M20]|nr:glycosyltransferase family 4 protein [archaeon AH-315-M20]
MEKKILVTASTFPRWKNDSTPRFVYDLSERLAIKYKLIVLAPHHKNAEKKETMGRLDIRRFVYFKPERLQKLCYGGGIIPNMGQSFLAKIQMPLLILFEFFASYRIIKKEHIGMLHAHWILPQGFVGVILKKLSKIPLLVSVHGSDLFPLRNKLFKKLQNIVMKNADYVTVNSNATKNELIKRFPAYSSKIKIIPMGVDINLFKKRKIQKPKKYEKNRILLFVGRLSDQKGLQYLVESMSDLVKYDSNIKLLVIGEGPYEKILRQRADSLGVTDNIVFLGSVPTSKVVEYHNFADIFILPSLSNKTGTEALGLSLLEAMASGCAVIGTNVGGISFAIKDGYNGLLVKQKDQHALSHAIITLLKNKQKSLNLGKNAAKFVRENYSWEIVSKDFIKIYAGLTK